MRLTRLALAFVGFGWLAACGGSAERSPGDQPSKGGTGSAASTAGSTSNAEAGGSSGSVGSAGAGVGGQAAGGITTTGGAGGAIPAGAAGGAIPIGGALTKPLACFVGIKPSALEGCRAPDEPNCASCYVKLPGILGCRVFSGAAPRDDYVAYDMATIVETCPADISACAACTRETEDMMCQYTERLECDCNIDAGIDPCYAPDSCGCFCTTAGLSRTACPWR